MSVHTIFVPEGWSVEQAWEHFRRAEPVPIVRIPADTREVEEVPGSWVNVDENGKLIVP